MILLLTQKKKLPPPLDNLHIQKRASEGVTSQPEIHSPSVFASHL